MNNDKEEYLTLTGVRENNLKNLSISLQHNSLIAVTGVSGSGKSTLAFDTIYAEGGRRYIETFSPYTRQFLNRLHRPKLDTISGVRSALALEQRNSASNSRSTVGTVTEINDYLKIAWAELAELYCPKCKIPVIRKTPAIVIDRILELSSQHNSEIVYITFPIHITGEATIASLIGTLQSEGYVRYFNEGEAKRIETLDDETLNSLNNKKLYVVVDRLKIKQLTSKERSRLYTSISQSYQAGHGHTVCFFQGTSYYQEEFIDALVCSSCEKSFPAPRESHFSFNSPIGACSTCNGFGKTLSIDSGLCVPDENKSIFEGAVQCWNTKATSREFKKLITFCEENSIDITIPWKKLSAKYQAVIFNGGESGRGYRGIYHWFKKLERKKYKMHVRVFLSRYRGEFICSTCNGTRLKPDSLLYEIDGLTLPDIWQLPLCEAYEFFKEVKQKRGKGEFNEIVIDEVISRLSYLTNIGLDYLTLDRQTRTLSGGEFQRVSLTAILGSRLVSTTLVLDEPTIGLHPRDTKRLVESLQALKTRGNTVVVVEHDPDVISQADKVIDLGPEAGSKGGEIVFNGTLNGLVKTKNSLTGRYLAGKETVDRENKSKKFQIKDQIIIKGCKKHNLKDIDVTIPLGGLVVLTGVSGSGKSTFVNDCLVNSYQRTKKGLPYNNVSSIVGENKVGNIILIDQSPVGKTPRSNPGTYTKSWDIIRECLSETTRAQQLGLSKSAFSFNVEGGRCSECQGAGFHRVEMQFLADVFVECEACGGSRFKDSVLEVRYGGKNVIDFLAMSLRDVVEFFNQRDENKVASKILPLIQPLVDLGLDYLSLGHPLNNLSGGEAQRIKLASYLGGKEKNCLFVLDEPTTGLHPHNINQLVETFDKLLEQGHSILCVEHNLDIIRNADWIIDLGPEGGIGGGEIVAFGPPEDVKKASDISYTARVLAKAKISNSKVETTKLKSKKENIVVTGARHHNLKNISVSISKNKFNVVTGVSGSGKSTLAFDIIFAEGQRRYIDCLSPYARQFIKQLERADVDVVDSIPPTVSLSQKTAPPLGVSTIATTTEIYQYLRLLFSKVGTLHCPDHDVPIIASSSETLAEEIIETYGGEKIYLFAPVVAGRKGYYNELFARALRAEIEEARIDGELVKLDPGLRLERHKLHWIELLVGSINNPGKNKSFLIDAITQCLLLGNGSIQIVSGHKSNEPRLFSTERACPECGRGFRELDPQDFSFRSNRGVCGGCGGRGHLGDEESASKGPTCPDCEGARIGEIGRHVYLDGKTIYELTQLTAPELLKFFNNYQYDKRLEPVVEPIVIELKARLSLIKEVGLEYLELDRDSPSISGGEAQRLRLARTLGSPLTGVCYVLDEPTIGLHPTDHKKLLEILYRLRDAGNTLVVVEHDEDTIRAADEIIDVGPRAGAGGGEIVVQGSVSEVEAAKNSITGQALRERASGKNFFLELPAYKTEFSPLELIGAKANNLKNVKASFPIGQLTVVAGVSGAGKSSLVHGSLIPAIFSEFEDSKPKGDLTWSELKNHDPIEKFAEIDQTPIGKTSTSTPASYLDILGEIRKLYAEIPEAKIRGWKASHFSFNSGKGKCMECSGKGFIKVPMSFLPDAISECERCKGFRFDDVTLEILYQGFSIGEVMQKTMTEAREVFANHRKIRQTLDYVYDLGLGYISLGQPTYTLSGGEAQRLKIARELSSRKAQNTLYVLDEPTTGLHMVDVEKLLIVVGKLLELGNTVVIIEHNLDVIRSAHQLIELGPEPGDRGGKIIFSGTPEKLLNSKKDTPTARSLRDS